MHSSILSSVADQRNCNYIQEMIMRESMKYDKN